MVQSKVRSWGGGGRSGEGCRRGVEHGEEWVKDEGMEGVGLEGGRAR